MKKLVALVLLTALMLVGCSKGDDEFSQIPDPVATITMTDGSVMRIQLNLKQAPNTVANFVKLCEEHFYDGMTFSRVVPGCLIQTGDSIGDGTGGPGWTIRGEFSKNGYKNEISHTRGTVSMARVAGDDNYDTAGSQFFIMQGSYPEYDGEYAAFGTLMDDESYATLDAIAAGAVDSSFRPLSPKRIESITVDTGGFVYLPVVTEDKKNGSDEKTD